MARPKNPDKQEDKDETVDSVKIAAQSFFKANKDIYTKLMESDVPRALAQYPLALGNFVGFSASGNLLQWEFCNWQRTKFSVNHEVRQIFLSIEKQLRFQYPWWSEISRADMTPAYIFARGSKGLPLP